MAGSINPKASTCKGFFGGTRTATGTITATITTGRIQSVADLLSASASIISYITMLFDPVKSAWTMAGLHGLASSRSFFLRAKGYDKVNHTTHEHKEEIKSATTQAKGYCTRLGTGCLGVWLDPTFFAFSPCTRARKRFHAPSAPRSAIRGAGAIALQELKLFFLKGVANRAGMGHKILTIHSRRINYAKGRLYLMRRAN